MPTRSPEIITRASEVDSDLVPEPWDARDNASDRSLVAERERYRLQGVTDGQGAGIVPAYALDVADTEAIPSNTQDGWTRGSAGRVLGPDGKYVSKGSDVPRKSFDGEDPGLLVEAAGRTNKVEHAADPSAWTAGGTSKPSLNDVTSMHSDEGTNNIINAKEVVNGGSTSSYVSTPAGTWSGNDETLTFWAERGTSGGFSLIAINTTSDNILFSGDYNFSSDLFSVVSGSVAEVNTRTLTGLAPNGNDVVEVRIRIGSGNSGNVGGESAQIRLYPSTSGDSKSTILHHAQLEKAPNASSPIVTQGSATTRSADDYTISVGDWFNPNEGTIIIEVTPKFYLAGGNFNLRTFLRAGTKASGFEWKGALELQLRVNSQFKNLSVTPFSKAKVAASFDSGTSSTVFSVNGSSTVINRSGFLSDIDSAGTLNFGDAVGTAFGSIVWVPRALPESTLNRITS